VNYSVEDRGGVVSVSITYIIIRTLSALLFARGLCFGEGALGRSEASRDRKGSAWLHLELWREEGKTGLLVSF